MGGDAEGIRPMGEEAVDGEVEEAELKDAMGGKGNGVEVWLQDFQCRGFGNVIGCGRAFSR